jgi:hypothetical protein
LGSSYEYKLPSINDEDDDKYEIDIIYGLASDFTTFTNNTLYFTPSNEDYAGDL